MRDAMYVAEVGDDVFGGDPTINKLEATVAELLGFEAGLYVPSGTQSNLCGLLSHCQRGDEYIVGDRAHTYRYEAGGAAVLGSIQPQPVRTLDDGRIDLEHVESVIKPADHHFANSRLLALENTIDGTPLPLSHHHEARALADTHGLRLHLDGARLWNAAVALGVTPGDVAAGFDSVSVCLSKGMGAPVGSVLVGSSDFIHEAHRWRKMLGGGMRQAGIIAAGCLYAVEHNIDRLADDHANAQRLAEGINDIDAMNARWTGSNMAFVTLDSPIDDLNAKLKAAGVSTFLDDEGGRLVTHLDVSAAEVEAALVVLQQLTT